MREPIGTTRPGQLLLGLLCALSGLGIATGLYVCPRPFALFADLSLAILSRGTLAYDEAHRLWSAMAFGAFGLAGAALFLRACLSQPAQDRAIDRRIWRRGLIDTSRRATQRTDEERGR